MSRLSRLLRQIRSDWSEHWFLCQGWSRPSSGVASRPGEVPLVVTLTTIAERLPKTAITVECLLRQTVKPDRLILWLDKKLEGKISTWLRRQMHRGLEIRLIEDIGPHTKIVYALDEFPGARIVTADDDVWYPDFWLNELLMAHEQSPDCIICHRAHRMLADERGTVFPYKQWDWCSPGQAGSSLWLFPTGVSGVLYPPNSLHSEVTNSSVFQKLCPTADDVWLKAMSLLGGVKCRKVAPFSRDWPVVGGTQFKNLAANNVERNQNDVQLRAVFEYYDLSSILQQNCLRPDGCADRAKPEGHAK